VYNEEKDLSNELNVLKQEHQALNEDTSILDQMSAQRVKKRKLWLKDQISRLEAIIYPDIIA
jgi:hypothetical protein